MIRRSFNTLHHHTIVYFLIASTCIYAFDKYLSLACRLCWSGRINMLSPSLAKLPPIVQNEIIEYLERVSSICAGLTCRNLYATHRQLHGKVDLHEFDHLLVDADQMHEVKLHFLIR